MSTATKTRGRWRAFAVGVAAALAVAAIPIPGHANDVLVIDKGLVDAFNVVAENDGLTLDLKEDVTGSHVRQDPGRVELNVKSAAFRTGLPDTIPGSPEGYVLPLVQDHDLLWLGWDTLPTQGSGFEPSIKLHFTEVTGPGTIHLFGQGTFGGTEPLLEGGATQLTAGAVRDQSFPAHTHANWVFGQPGVYRITLHATGVKDGQEVRSNDATYTFTVGDEFRGKGYEPDADPDPEPTPDPTPDPTPTSDPDPTPTSDPDPTPTSDPGPTQAPDPTPEPTQTPDPTPDPVPSSSAPAPLGEPGTSAPPAAARVCKPVEVKRPATPEEIKAAGEQPRDASGSGTAPKEGKAPSAGATEGSYTVPANTHVHPNWVFTKPGTYTLTVRQTTKSKSGEPLSATGTLTFQVGPGASGANNGHFDFGAQIVDGKLAAKIKDDRQSPATWVEPNSLTFALGDTAKTTIPAGLEFLAPAGSQVWMIASAQVNGVPWLGANTQHESLLAGSTGEVTFTLESATGPGKVGVFTSGSLGQIVGEKWFTYTPGAAGAKDAPAADAPAAAKPKITTVGGKQMVIEKKWQYPDGQPCTPPKGLPRTGADTGAMTGSEATGGSGAALAALAVVAFGAAALRRSGA